MAERDLGDEMALMHMAGLAELGIIPPVCPWCEGRGYFDSRHEGHSGHMTCTWCYGTGNAPKTTGKQP